MEILLNICGLTKTYGSGSTKVLALNDVSFNLYKKESVAVIGTSGSGKSTLLHLIGGMDHATSGKILYYQMENEVKNLCTASDRELADYRKKNVGFVFQNFELIPELTAKENILLPMPINHLKTDMAFFEYIVDKLHLQTRLSHYPGELSGGQKQRVAIARAIIHSPKLLLCDEPTGNLDEKNGKEVMELLIQLQQELGQTILVVTHDKNVVANCERKIEIWDGNILNPA